MPLLNLFQNDKDSLIFRKTVIPSPCSFFAISFNEGDKLRLIGAPNDVINAVKRALGRQIQREDWKVQAVAYQFKILGYGDSFEGMFISQSCSN